MGVTAVRWQRCDRMLWQHSVCTVSVGDQSQLAAVKAEKASEICFSMTWWERR